uniref:Ig-like domain-containing protein n=1 Tax=Meleagris gallopavo TaxID=9103 RepID=G3URM6_MELGA
MAGSPALLLLLSLGLCCNGAQGQGNTTEARFLDRTMKHPQEGQRLELECTSYNSYSGVSWVRQDKDGKLHFIVYISMFSQTTYPGYAKSSSQFEGSKQGNSYRLVVKSFRAQDQGTYFCITNIEPMLHFSSGQPAFFPVTTTAEPTTSTATTQSSQVTMKDNSQQDSDAAEHITSTTTTQSSQATMKDNSQQGPDAAEHITSTTTTQWSQVTMKDNSQQGPHAGTSNDNTPRFYCTMTMWVNLSCACLLLLTAITITTTHCQRPSSA